jgi:hypothetical protein
MHLHILCAVSLPLLRINLWFALDPQEYCMKNSVLIVQQRAAQNELRRKTSCKQINLDPSRTSYGRVQVFFSSNATTCPLWTSWSPFPVVAEV